MNGEINLATLIKSMKPTRNDGEFVFINSADFSGIPINEVVMMFKETEGYTIILQRNVADDLKLDYSFVAAWIILSVHSSLEAVGLTATGSKALADHHISCNVVAAFYHDHLFIPLPDAEKAMRVLTELSSGG